MEVLVVCVICELAGTLLGLVVHSEELLVVGDRLVLPLGLSSDAGLVDRTHEVFGSSSMSAAVLGGFRGIRARIGLVARVAVAPITLK